MKLKIQSCVMLALVFVFVVSFTSRADLYLTYGNNSLGLFTDAGVLIRNVATNLSNPQGVAVDGLGNVFVADYGNKRVRMYDKAGNFVRDVVSTNYSGGSTPSGLSVRADGQLIVTLNLGNSPSQDQFVTFNTTATDDWFTYNNYGSWGAGYRAGYYSTSQNRFYASTIGYGVQYFDGANLSTYLGNAFPLGGASGITMDGSGNLYAVSYDGYIAKWDGVNAQNYAFINNGLNFPLGITFDTAANDLYVANYNGGNVQTYDLNGTLLGSFNVANPAYLAYVTNTVHSVTVQTNLYISYGGNSLGKFTTAGVKILDLATNLSNPQGVAVDRAGNVFVSDFGNGRIRMYDAAGIFVRDVMNTNYSDGTYQPFGLALDGNSGRIASTIYHPSDGSAQLIEWNISATNSLGNYQGLGGQYQGLAYNELANKLYASVSTVVQQFNGNSMAYEANAVGGFTAPRGLAFEGQNLFVVDNTGTVWNNTGASNIVTGLTGPLGIAADSAGALYVADYSANAVKIYTTTGATLASFSLNNPAYLAYGTLLVPVMNSVVIPTLSVQLAPGNQVRLAWTTNAPGFTLESTSGLPGGWTTNAAAVSISGTNFVAFDAVSGGQKFYRLIK